MAIRSPLSLLRKFDFFHSFCVIFVLLDYKKCMEELSFSKKEQRAAICTPNLVCSFFKLISYIFQRERDKYSISKN